MGAKGLKLPKLVTQAEAEAGILTEIKSWTPERVKQAITSLASSSNKVVKPADETFDVDVTLTDDADLLLPLLANKHYFFMAVIKLQTDGADDFSFAFGTPSGANATKITNALSGSTLASTEDATTRKNLPSNGNVLILTIVGTVETSVTAGNLVFQRSGNNQTAGNMTVFGGSYIEAWEQ